MIEEGKFYTGIGSRKTPHQILSVMTSVASLFEQKGMILRSGGADGADSAFESGVSDHTMKEIYLPWKGFNGRSEENGISKYSDCHVDIASCNHPAWSFLGRGPRALHTRNVAQILGMDCQTLSNFVMCWTPGGEAKGGTATAIRIAWGNDIPVFNLYNETALNAVKKFLESGIFDEEAWRTI